VEAAVRGQERVHQAAQGVLRHPGGRAGGRAGPQGAAVHRGRGPVGIDRLGPDHQRVPRADAPVEGGRAGRPGIRDRAVETLPGRPGQVLHRPVGGVLGQGRRAARARRGQAAAAGSGSGPAAGDRHPGGPVRAARHPGALGADRRGAAGLARALGVRAAAGRGGGPQGRRSPVAPVEPRGAGPGRGHGGPAAFDHRPAGRAAGQGAGAGRRPGRARRRGSPHRPPRLAGRGRAHAGRVHSVIPGGTTPLGPPGFPLRC